VAKKKTKTTKATKATTTTTATTQTERAAMAAAPTDQIRLELSWAEDREAILIGVIDNDHAVALPGPGIRGRGSVACTYRTAPAATHVVEWRLTFNGKLSDLAATGAVNGAAEQDLVSSPGEDSVWAGRGVL
jgi:hypothetical protein